MEEGWLEILDGVNIIVAVALEKGVITLVGCQADTGDNFDLARENNRLVDLVGKGEHLRDTLRAALLS